MGHVLHGNCDPEVVVIQLIGILTTQLSSELEEVQELLDEVKSISISKVSHLAMDLLRVIENLSIQILNFCCVPEELDHVLHEICAKNVGFTRSFLVDRQFENFEVELMYAIILELMD